MSGDYKLTMRCCRCRASVEFTGPSWSAVSAEAKRTGWRRRHGSDYCPQHPPPRRPW